MIPNPKVLVVAVGLALAAAGCQGPAGSPGAAGEKLYDVKGKVVSVDPEKKRVELDHEDIPGLMRAMTMPFAVEDPKLLDGLKPGDAVQGKLKVESGKYVLTRIEKR